jgi:hypothetical protein
MFMEVYKITVPGTEKSPGGIESRDWTRIGQGDGFRVIKHPTKKYYLQRNARCRKCLALQYRYAGVDHNSALAVRRSKYISTGMLQWK